MAPPSSAVAVEEKDELVPVPSLHTPTSDNLLRTRGDLLRARRKESAQAAAAMPFPQFAKKVRAQIKSAGSKLKAAAKTLQVDGADPKRTLACLWSEWEETVHGLLQPFFRLKNQLYGYSDSDEKAELGLEMHAIEQRLVDSLTEIRDVKITVFNVAKGGDVSVDTNEPMNKVGLERLVRDTVRGD